MENIDLVEQSKIKNFLAACDELINGKFILADIKIMRVLNLIADCEPLYRYINECLIDFNFEREYSRAEVKNRFNNGQFIVPQEKEKLVALVYNLFTAFEKKQIDFYSFVNNNFATLNGGGEYENFTQSVIVPFKNAIAIQFGLMEDNMQNAQEQPNEEETEEQKEEKNEIETIWDDIAVLVDSLINIVSNERKIKADAKENILYVLKSIKYCSKYNDMRLVSSLLLSAEMLLVKVNSTKIVISEIKNEIRAYYDLATKKE